MQPYTLSPKPVVSFLAKKQTRSSGTESFLLSLFCSRLSIDRSIAQNFDSAGDSSDNPTTVRKLAKHPKTLPAQVCQWPRLNPRACLLICVNPMSNEESLSNSAPPQPGTTAQIDPLLGTLFEAKYKIVAKLGEGGMGAVYRAHHIHMDLDVAIKFLHESMTSDPQILERFKREAKAAGRISHPNATQVMDFGVLGNNTAYLVMEYLEGESLRERLYRQKLPLKEAVAILSQACAAVDAAHKKGVIHRDLKPDNIFLKRQEEGHETVKVLDFGIAKLRDKSGENQSTNLTEAGMLIGTPHYMSPEQCHGHELDPSSDIYSLGVIAYEMFAGELPFRAPTSLGIVLKHINEEPPPLYLANPQIPREVEKVVLRALSKNPTHRPETASQFARELEAAAEGNDIISTNQLDGSAASFRTSMLASQSIAADLVQTMEDAPALSTSMMSSPLTGGHTTAETARFDTSDPPNNRRTLLNRSVAPRPATPPGTENPTLLAPANTPSSSNRGVTPVEMEMPFPGGTRKMVSDAPSQSNLPVVKPAGSLVFKAGLATVALLVVGAVGYAIYPRNAGTGAPATIKVVENVPPASPKIPEGMVLIEGSTFTMGRDPGPKVSLDETPAHEVTVKTFAIGKYEVSCKEYAEFVKATGYPVPQDWRDGTYPAGKDQYPVTFVSWDDGSAYCKWLKDKTGLPYRLPTEEEWEYAARGKDKRMYPWGDEYDPRFANIRVTETTLPVAVDSMSQAQDLSPFKIVAMTGNVSEWTASDYNLYPNSQGKPDRNKGKKILKIGRGGNFGSQKETSTTTYRQWYESTEKHEFLGFRIALDTISK